MENGGRRSKGFGFVTFGSTDEANECKAALDNRVSGNENNGIFFPRFLCFSFCSHGFTLIC